MTHRGAGVKLNMTAKLIQFARGPQDLPFHVINQIRANPCIYYRYPFRCRSAKHKANTAHAAPLDRYMLRDA